MAAGANKLGIGLTNKGLAGANECGLGLTNMGLGLVKMGWGKRLGAGPTNRVRG